MNKTEIFDKLDLSIENISELVAGDKSKGKELIEQLSNEYFKYKEEIQAKSQELEKLNNYIVKLRIGISRVMGHLHIDTPLAIIESNSLIVITTKDITRETNIL
jgi:hypothetical protein